MFHKHFHHFVLDRWVVASSTVMCWSSLSCWSAQSSCLFQHSFLEKSANMSLTLYPALSLRISLTIKCHTETRVHCQVIPMKCLLCLYNGHHLGILVISDWECAQCSIWPNLNQISQIRWGNVPHLEDVILMGKWMPINKAKESAFVQQLHWLFHNIILYFWILEFQQINVTFVKEIA